MLIASKTNKDEVGEAALEGEQLGSTKANDQSGCTSGKYECGIALGVAAFVVGLIAFVKYRKS